jgi:hypothetical protein
MGSTCSNFFMSASIFAIRLPLHLRVGAISKIFSNINSSYSSIVNVYGHGTGGLVLTPTYCSSSLRLVTQFLLHKGESIYLHTSGVAIIQANCFLGESAIHTSDILLHSFLKHMLFTLVLILLFE